MSSWKNVAPSRARKERAQPAARARFGLLEKHKDYVQRARNFHAKEHRLIALRRRAEFRNPDEYYSKMLTESTDGGVHHLRPESERPSAEALHLLKTQDVKYVSLMATAEAKKAARLRASLHDLRPRGTAGGSGGGSHLLFVDSAADARAFDPAVAFDTAPELVDRAFNRPRVATLAASAASLAAPPPERAVRGLKRAREDAYAELGAREDRAKRLAAVADTFRTQRALLGKGRREKVGEAKGDRPPVFRWAQQRKR
jgi:U3 small nucleolar RNA-associated protein 11